MSDSSNCKRGSPPVKSVAAVCFAYIGFDSISTTAEECKNPQRDIPKAMMWALIICTVLYVMVTLVLTGIVPSGDLAGIEDPLAFMFSSESASGASSVFRTMIASSFDLARSPQKRHYL